MISRRAARCAFLLLVPFLAWGGAFGAPEPVAEGPGDGAVSRRFQGGAARIVSGFEQGHGFQSWFPTGSVRTDTEVRRSGGSSLRLASEGGPVAAERALARPVDLREGSLRLWIRVADVPALARLSLQATGDDWESFVTYRLEDRVAPADEGRWLRVAATDWQAEVHGPRPTLVDRIRIRVDGRAGDVAVVHVDDLASVPRGPTGVVSLAFDDGWASQAQVARPIMERFGFRGTAFVVPYLVGEPGYMSEDDLRGLYDAGWDLSGHYHPSLRGRQDPELSHILRSVRSYLDDRGWDRASWIFAYPEGFFGEPALVPAVERRFDAARTIVEGLEALPPPDPMRLRSVPVLPDGDPDRIRAALRAAKRDRAWLILVFHKLEDDPEHPTELAPAAFERVLGLVAASGLPVRTMSEVLEPGPDPERE